MILPNHFIEIIRVNNLNPDKNLNISTGYAMNQVYEFIKKHSDDDGENHGFQLENKTNSFASCNFGEWRLRIYYFVSFYKTI